MDVPHLRVSSPACNGFLSKKRLSRFVTGTKNIPLLGRIKWKIAKRDNLNEAPPEGAQDGPAHQQCLKSKSPFTVGGGGGGGVHGGQLPTFDAESKSAKIPKSLYGEGGGGGVVHVGQLPTFDAESKSAKIPKSLYSGGGCMTANFQLLMLSPNLLKSQSPFTVGGGGGVA